MYRLLYSRNFRVKTVIAAAWVANTSSGYVKITKKLVLWQLNLSNSNGSNI